MGKNSEAGNLSYQETRQMLLKNENLSKGLLTDYSCLSATELLRTKMNV
jgi:hypothetical protein